LNDAYHYLDSNEQLEQACKRWQSAEFVALDTEFIRRDTFYPIAGLIQVGALGECWLIDPIAITDWEGFKGLLNNAGIPKVLHSCSEDLDVFQRLCGALPAPLLDSQIGAGLAGWGEGLSYQKLVAHSLNEHVEKGETRSNWLQRPLTASQCHYAALDVAYLQDIYPLLRRRLEELGRLPWWQEDCRQLIEQADQGTPSDQFYLRNKSLWKLNGCQRLVLQRVCAWREEQARQRDVPRGRIFKDPVCFEIARRQPSSSGELARIKDLPSSSLRRFGDDVLTIVREAREADSAAHPPAGERPLSAEQTQYLATMRRGVERCADSLGIPAGLLCRKRDMEEVIRHRRLPDSMTAWRKRVVGEVLLQSLEGA
jgi:ribonuclease D